MSLLNISIDDPPDLTTGGPQSHPTGLHARLLQMRDRLLASASFRRWATAFPLTRPIARRRARALFDLCAGFVYSQVLLSCVRLRLPEILAEGPQSLSVIAPRLSLSLDATTRLLLAAASLRLVERRRDGRFGLGVLGAALIDNPGITAMIEHHALLYGDLHDPVALLRGEARATELGRYWPYAGEAVASLPAERFAPYTALMAASQPFIADEILSAYRLDRHRCLLDVGGGDGSFLNAAAARTPTLRVILFDLPAVAERAHARFAAAGISTRAATAGGDFRTDTLPQGADIVSLVRVVHDHDDATVRRILRAVHAALPDGGTLLLAEPMAGTPGAEPIGDAYFGFYLLAMGRGRARTVAELTALLHEAGFDSVRRLPTNTPMLTGVITARRVTLTRDM